MAIGFEINEVDVSHVLERMGLPADEEVALAVLRSLDQKACENAALQGLDIEDQTDGAYQEIQRQIEERNLVPRTARFTSGPSL